MRLCPHCNKHKIKNNYKQCYHCSQKEDSSSERSEFSQEENFEPTSRKSSKNFLRDEPETVEVAKRENIPKTVRNALWINFFKTEREGKCRCCLRETISIGNFHAGHIKAHANGGLTTLDNLVPICALCNLSMQKMDLNEFIVKYNLHFGL
jgi:hypothetical protein